jgi:hypothetical protein
MDFDAVSLYPASMKRLYTVRGLPELISSEYLDYNKLKKDSTFFVIEIEITAVNKHYDFPLLAIPDKSVQTLEWSDEYQVGKRVVVNKTALSDLVKFQKIEFKIIRGYMWQGTKDYSISKLIDSLFLTRKKLKGSKNPLEIVYKLILNNIYGKTIQKPILKDSKFIRGTEKVNRYISRNHIKFISCEMIAPEFYRVDVRKPTTEFANNCLLGGHILAKSKRIMNEVMCLSQDIGNKIFYQDTDSFFTSAQDLGKLESEFKNRYKRELVGKDLGQFHSDFCTRDGKQDAVCATECYFIRKKLYCCKLLMTDGTYNISYRAKGFSPKVVEKKALARNPGMNITDAIIDLYKSVYNGEKIEIDLAEAVPIFKFSKAFNVSSLSSFKRLMSR